jgi:hypothetical protein
VSRSQRRRTSNATGESAHAPQRPSIPPGKRTLVERRYGAHAAAMPQRDQSPADRAEPIQDPFDWRELTDGQQSETSADRTDEPAGEAPNERMTGEANHPAASEPAPLSITPTTPLPELAEALAALDDEELRARRARLTARLAAPALLPDVRLTIVRQRDAIEWLQHRRQLERGDAPSAHAAAPTGEELASAAPLQGASALDVAARARLESEVRTGSAAQEQRAYAHLAGHGTRAQSDALTRQHVAIGAEQQVFLAELRSTAQRSAHAMLDVSTRDIEAALAQYGLRGGSFRLTTAAKQYLHDPEALPQILADWRTLSHTARPSPRGVAAQAELAATVATLRAQQRRVEELEREERGFTEADWMRRDAIDPARSSQSAKAELAEAWLVAEERHPILLTFRHPRHGADADRLDGLDAAGAGLEETVLRQAVPKLANILRTKQELGSGRLDPMRLAPVLEVAKLKMCVPPGSQRAALVAELHREASQTSLAEHVLSALQLGLSLLSFVPGVGAGAKVLAEATSLALELHAQVHEYKEWRSAGGMNNTALDIARSVSQQAPGLRPLLLRLAVAGASTASVLQLGRLALKLDRARQLTAAAHSSESVDDVLRELDALGESVGIQHLGDKVDAVGGVRGAAVYPKKMFVKDGAERMSKLNLEKVKDCLKKVTARDHLGGAKLETQLAEATAETARGTLRIPAPGASAAASASAAEVRIELRFRGELTPSTIHGAEAGPARYTLERSAEAHWIARIEVDQHLDPRDVDFVLSHELDEISEIVRRHPAGATAPVFEREMGAGVMRAGSTTTAVTAHDVANAREIVALQRDYDNLLTAKSPHAEARKQMLDRAIESAGLGEASQIDAKVQLLREAGAPEELLNRVRRVESRRLMGEHAERMGAQASKLDESMIDHVLWARERTGGAFIEKGVNGGHHTKRLLALGWPNGEYVFVEVASKPAAGSVARRFEQYQWTGKGHMPAPGSGHFPGEKHFDPAGWAKSEMPKTTLDDPSALLSEGEEAWQTWLDAGAIPTGGDNRFAATTKSGLRISGFFNRPPAAMAPSSIFVEASWF